MTRHIDIAADEWPALSWGRGRSLSREGVISAVHRWQQAGCVVGISETTSIGDPDEAYSIDLALRGTRSGIAAVTPERLTIFRPGGQKCY